ILFEIASSTKLERADFYDAIFCMAVLRDGRLSQPGVMRCDHLIRFDDFAYMVGDFSRCLKPGGLLVIRHCNFRLADAPAGPGFETIMCLKNLTGVSPIFGPDNRLMAEIEYPDTVFRKRSKHQPIGGPIEQLKNQRLYDLRCRR
ncbi:MAG TPA: hypothetical protein VK629_02210, partial [Steroidobacteraceae bacterium]|nr:hypothetical protein [Steroidobacteraceae bacterium]